MSVSGGCVIVRPQPIPYKKGKKINICLMSDLHIGAPTVDYDLIKEELEEAKKLNARILVNGDIFDLILAKDHKRYSPEGLHPRLQGRADIINESVRWGVEIFKDYADQIDMICEGNHCSKIEKYHNVDVIQMLIEELQRGVKNPKHLIHHGGYSGFIDYRFRYINKKDKQSRGSGKRFVIYYHHGAGGSSPITKGTTDLSRKGWVDADVVWLGHKHTKVSTHIRTMRCPQAGYDPVVRDVREIITGSYMDTYAGQTQESIRRHGRLSNYAADAGMAPQGKGGVRLTLNFPSPDKPLTTKVIY